MDLRGSAGRSVLGALSVAVGAVLVWLSWGPLRNLFADYQDSHPLVYLLFGAVFLVPGVVLVVAGVSLLRRGDPR